MAKPMTPIPGLYVRGKTWWLKIVCPTALRAQFNEGKKLAFHSTLATTDAAEARVIASAKRAEYEALWLRQSREAAPPKLAVIPASLRTVIANAVYAAEVKTDSLQRADKSLTVRMVSGVHIGDISTRPDYPQVSRLAPLPAATVSARTTYNLRRQQFVQDAIASGNLEVMVPIAERAARSLGLVIAWDTDDGAATLEACLHAYSRARAAAVERDAGRVVETPATPELPKDVNASVKPTDGKLHLRDVLADWKAAKPRKDRAIKNAERALGILERAGQDKPLADLERSHGASVRAYLLTLGLRGKSAKNNFAPLQALMNTAVDVGKLKLNPWAGLRFDTSDSVERLPWSLSDLEKLVDCPLFMEGDTADWCRYWVFVLGLHTGSRIGELAQLALSDVQEIEGVACIEIHDRKESSGDKRTTKTKGSNRWVPVHRRVVDLGFLEHVERMRAAGESKVFPSLHRAGRRTPSDLMTEWFLEHRKASGVQIDERWTFHSLRHNIRSALVAKNQNERVIDRLIGHSDKGVQARYTHVAMSVFSETLNQLDWPLALPRVYNIEK